MKNRLLPLVVALTASVTAGAGFVTPDAALAREEIVADWASDIPAMLAAGDHLQGQVVAGVVSSGRGHEGNEILKEGEDVMDISEAGTDLFGEQIPDDGELHVIDALVPLSEMFGYATDLRSRSQGRGTFTMQFAQYESVPRSIATKILGTANYQNI